MSILPGQLAGFLAAAKNAVLVEIVRARGSTPREVGAFMVVGPAASLGTVGGGRLEYLALRHARLLLERGEGAGEMELALGPELAQCCGGRVELSFQVLDDRSAAAFTARVEREHAGRPHLYVFGAGHVGNALARALSRLPYRTLLVDTRKDELEAAPEGIETLLAALPEAVVRQAPPGSGFVILTHDHGLDFLIAREALERGDAAYVGMIGSKTKKATFRSWLAREGADPGLARHLTTPIGGADVRDKRAEVIAALTAAELVRALAAGQGRAQKIHEGALAG